MWVVFNRGHVVLTSKDVSLVNCKNKQIRYGTGNLIGGADEYENKANKNILIERRRRERRRIVKGITRYPRALFVLISLP